MSGRAAEVAAVAALALALTAGVAAPVLRAPSERIFGMEIVGRHRDPFTMMEQFKRPIADLAHGLYAQPLTEIPGALLERASGPVAAYNWLVLLTFPLAAAAAYLLARHLKLAPAGAAMAALAFTFSPFHLAQAAYHPHIAQVQWVALYFFALWRCLDDATPAAACLLAVSVVGVALSNFYGGLVAAVITPAAAAAYWFFVSRSRPRSLRQVAVTAGTLAMLAGGGIAYIWYAARPLFLTPTAFGALHNDLFRYSATWRSYLMPPVEHPLLGTLAARAWHASGVDVGLLEQQVSLGWGLMALDVAAVWYWVRRRRQPTSLAAVLAAVPVLATVALVAFLCSLPPALTVGPVTVGTPSALLSRVAPVFRAYARFGVVVQLMAALLAGIGAERLWRTGTWRTRVACVALLALAAGEYAVWPPAMWRDVLPTTAHRWVTRQADRMNVLDCAALTAESESVQWLSGNRISLRPPWLGDCEEPNFPDKLSAFGYTHLLVQRDTAEGRWFTHQPTPEGLQVQASFDDGDVFAVTSRPPGIYTLRMTAFSPREHDETWTWRWMGAEASWTVVNRSERPLVADLEVGMTAFHRARGLTLLLDGSEVQTLTVKQQRGSYRVGQLALTPGEHVLVFRPTEPPTVADEVMGNGDHRPLSLAVGAWRWTVEGGHP